MTLNREQLNKFAQPIVDVYNSIEMELLENIVTGLKGKTKLLDEDPEKWRLQLMENLGIVDEQNLKILKENLQIGSNDLNKILFSAGLEGMQVGEERIERALKKGAHLVKPEPINESPVIFDILRGFSNQAMSTLNLTNQSLLDNSKQAYIDILNQASLRVSTGISSGEEAVRRTIKEWADSGIPVLKDKAGRKRGVEGYVRMVMVTSTNNAVNQMEDERFDQWGVDYTEVSSHSGARPLCAPYQGKVFALSPEKATPQYPYIGTTSMGKPAGLFGINCGHHKYPFVPGITEQTYTPYDEKKNAKTYKNSQRQRAIERSIRQAKTRENMLKAAGDEAGALAARNLVNQRFARMRDFIDKTGRKRRRYREQIVLGSQKPRVPNVKIPKHLRKAPDNKPDNHMPKVANPNLPKVNPSVGDIATFVVNGKELFGEVKNVGEDNVQISRLDDVKDDDIGKRVKVPIADIKDVTKKTDENPEPPKPEHQSTADKFEDKNQSSRAIELEEIKDNPLYDPDNYEYASTPKKKNVFIEEGKKNYKALSREDRDALGNYVQTGNSFNLNRMLYSGEYDEMKELLNKGEDIHPRVVKDMKDIDDISRVIQNHRIPKDMKVARNVDADFLKAVLKELKVDAEFTSQENVVEVLKEELTGVAFMNKSFTSTSYNPKDNVFKDKPIQMELLVEKGTRGFVTNNEIESEVIFDRGTEIQFIDFQLVDDKIKIIAKIVHDGSE